jgi:hypothetical protein
MWRTMKLLGVANLEVLNAAHATQVRRVIARDP